MKQMTTLILGLSLTLCAICLAGCTSKPTADNASKSVATVSSNTSSANTSSADASELKNSTPIKVSTVTVQKSVQQGTKEEIKLSSIDSTLNSIGNFTVTDDSGIK